MSQINFALREISCKVVYYGPGMGGKTSNLKHVHAKVPEDLRGKLISVETEDERTLFFDFLPLDLGTVKGFKTRFHLYTVPGQTFYNASRKLVLRGVDGVVFVADSSPHRLRANAESMRNLRENLKAHGIDPDTLPMVLQINKRDVPGALPTEMIRAVIDPDKRYITFEAQASAGLGVFETLRDISRLVLERLKGHGAKGGPAATSRP